MPEGFGRGRGLLRQQAGSCCICYFRTIICLLLSIYSSYPLQCDLRFSATAAREQSSHFANRGCDCPPRLTATSACQFYDLSMPLFSLPAASKTLMETLESSAVALKIDTATRAQLSRSVPLAFDTNPQERARPAHNDGS